VFDITRHGEAFIGVKLCLGGGCFDKMVDIYLDLEDLRKSNSFLSKITPCCGTLSVHVKGEMHNVLPEVQDRVIW
jgi:hypothetical protein